MPVGRCDWSLRYCVAPIAADWWQIYLGGGAGRHTRGYTQCMTCWPCVWAGGVTFRVLWFGLHSRWRVKKQQYVWSEFWIPFAVVKETLIFLQVCPSTRTRSLFWWSSGKAKKMIESWYSSKSLRTKFPLCFNRHDRGDFVVKMV